MNTATLAFAGVWPKKGCGRRSNRRWYRSATTHNANQVGSERRRAVRCSDCCASALSADTRKRGRGRLFLDYLPLDHRLVRQ